MPGEGIRGGVRGARLALSPALICVGPCTRIYVSGLGLLFVNWVQRFPVRVILRIEGLSKCKVSGHKSCKGGGCSWCLLSTSGQNLPLFTLC